MNRGHDVDSYRKIIDRIRNLRPDLALSSDFIVGFPGEGDEEFEETMKVVREIGYVQAFSFKYSRRPGTPGSVMPMQVPDSVKASRLQILQDELQRQTTSFAEGLVGRSMDVLVEKKGRHEGQLVGRSPYLQPVFFDGQEDEIGRMVSVDIIGVQANSLAARRSGDDH
jgi:2-methylthioadenine synthetase